MPASPKTPQKKQSAGSGPASPISPSSSPRPSPRLASPGSFLKRAVSAGWKRRQDPLEHPLPPGSVSSSDFDTSPTSPRSPNVVGRRTSRGGLSSSRFSSPATSPLISPSSISFPKSVSSSTFLPNNSEPDFEMVTQTSYVHRPSPQVPSERSPGFATESPQTLQTESTASLVSFQPEVLSVKHVSPASQQKSAHQDEPFVSGEASSPSVPAMAPKRRESLRRRSSVKQQGLGIDNLPNSSLSPSRGKPSFASSSRFATPEPEEPPLVRTDSNSSITEEIMTVSPVSPALQTPPLSITPKRQPSVGSLNRANSVAASLSSREGSTDPSMPVVPPRGGGIRRHSSLKDFGEYERIGEEGRKTELFSTNSTDTDNAAAMWTCHARVFQYMYGHPSASARCLVIICLGHPGFSRWSLSCACTSGQIGPHFTISVLPLRFVKF